MEDLLEGLLEFRKLKKLKKKLKYGVMGCGCLLICIVIFGVLLAGVTGGAIGYLSEAVRGLGIQLPQGIRLPVSISLPQEVQLPPINLPRLPANPLKLSDREQILLGRQVAAEQGLDQSAAANRRISRIASRLVESLPEKYRGPKDLGGWEWRFRELRPADGTVNAIALPGGKVYVYQGLTELTAGDDNELAAVLAHEMAHVVEEHSAEQLLAAGLLQTAVNLLIQNSGGGGTQEDMIRVLATQMGRQVTEMQLSQAAEYQADEIGFRLMTAAGYDPVAGLDILRKLGKLKGGKGSFLSGVFSTHPPADKRVKRLQEKVIKAGK